MLVYTHRRLLSLYTLVHAPSRSPSAIGKSAAATGRPSSLSTPKVYAALGVGRTSSVTPRDARYSRAAAGSPPLGSTRAPVQVSSQRIHERARHSRRGQHWAYVACVRVHTHARECTRTRARARTRVHDDAIVSARTCADDERLDRRPEQFEHLETPRRDLGG